MGPGGLTTAASFWITAVARIANGRTHAPLPNHSPSPYARHPSLPRTALRSQARRLAVERHRSAVRRDRPGAARPALQGAPGERHPADPQPRRAGRRRLEQPLHAGRQVSEELAGRRGAGQRVASGRLRLSSGVSLRRSGVHAPRVHGPLPAWSGSAKAASIRTKKPSRARRPIACC